MMRKEERDSDVCVQMIRSILMLALKKPLKNLYQISSTAVAMASLRVENPEINKRDKTISGIEVKEISIPSITFHIPETEKEFISLAKSFQSVTVTDPVENLKKRAKRIEK